MIEPTENESKEELDLFLEAMPAIAQEDHLKQPGWWPRKGGRSACAECHEIQTRG